MATKGLSITQLNKKIQDLNQSKKALTDKLKKTAAAAAKKKIQASLNNVNAELNKYKAQVKKAATGANIVAKAAGKTAVNTGKSVGKSVLDSFMNQYLKKSIDKTLVKFSVKSPSYTWGILRVWLTFGCNVKVSLDGGINTSGATLKGGASGSVSLTASGRIGIKLWALNASVVISLVGALNIGTNYTANLKLSGSNLVGSLTVNGIAADASLTATLEIPAWFVKVANKMRKRGKIKTKFSHKLGSLQLCKIYLPHLSVTFSPAQGKFTKTVVSGKVKVEAGKDVKAIGERIINALK